ncbi:MAG TPA: tyrosine-type recombinase/integrase [Noviherbaspirillum sp.]|uniref:tyrosine-type recombinase/integrase n=1 Tax=Noviherbaspirillum sp. TaxID=1926288 RepID=UPI002B49E2ED|nr:tyrosine-type recombinase/integrase [Noviherbaspirillum sp.]HJV86961.1 tyrosine-type recombinase/integrase [Noviherbaspirillum sp.]
MNSVIPLHNRGASCNNSGTLRLMYGAGMRLMECMTLRVKDVGFGRREIIIREGKSG